MFWRFGEPFQHGITLIESHASIYSNKFIPLLFEMNLNYIKELGKLRKYYRLDTWIFISSCYGQPWITRSGPSRICKRASSLELDSPMFSSVSESSPSFWSVGFSGAMSVFSTDGRAVRHKGHRRDCPMTCSIQAWQKICLHIVILAVSLLYGSKHILRQFHIKDGHTGQSSCASIEISIICCSKVMFAAVNSTVGVLARSSNPCNRSRHIDQWSYN